MSPDPMVVPVMLKLTAHQARVLDALIRFDLKTAKPGEDLAPALSRQDYLREMIKERYKTRVTYSKMEQVPRED